MFVKDLLGLCLVDPLVATIFFFRGSTAVRIRLPAADLLGIYVVASFLCPPSADYFRNIPQTQRKVALECCRPPKGWMYGRESDAHFCVWLCLSFGGGVICGPKAAASS
jgi:hypothetical protein